MWLCCEALDIPTAECTGPEAPCDDLLRSEPTTGVSPPGSEPLDLQTAMDRHQRRLIEAAVAREGGNWAAAGRALGVNRSNLHRMARRLGLK